MEWGFWICVAGIILLLLSSVWNAWWFYIGGLARWNNHCGSIVYGIVSATATSFLLASEYDVMLLWFIGVMALAALLQSAVIDDFFRIEVFGDHFREYTVLAVHGLFLFAAFYGTAHPEAALVYTTVAAALLLSCLRQVYTWLFRKRYHVKNEMDMMNRPPIIWQQKWIHALSILAHLFLSAALLTRDQTGEQTQRVFLVLYAVIPILSQTIANWWSSLTDGIHDVPFVTYFYKYPVYSTKAVY